MPVYSSSLTTVVVVVVDDGDPVLGELGRVPAAGPDCLNAGRRRVVRASTGGAR